MRPQAAGTQAAGTQAAGTASAVPEHGHGGQAALAREALPSPVGDLHVACSSAGLAQVSFGAPPSRPARPDAAPARARALAAGARRQLADYFAGRLRVFTVPVDWSWASPAQQRVLSTLLTAAGYGQTVTYGELARIAGLTSPGEPAALAAGDPGMPPLPGQPGGAPARYRPPARVVGQIMAANRCPIVVPCHRVVADGGLGGYSGGTGIEIKRWLLVFEGALPPTLDWDPAGPAAGQAVR